MKNYSSEYKLIKDKVLQVLTSTALKLEEMDKKDESESILGQVNSLENDRFSIVVVGQFSAGKSTFLNALMREKYLPSFKNETTATINFLRSTSDSPNGKPLIQANYRDGHNELCEEVTLENIERFVSTRGKDQGIDVAKEIESVDIYLDSQFLNDGVTLVDSPGLNGIAEGHEDITNDQIKKSHAAIFMLNAHQPGSSVDYQILENLLKRYRSIFIVLNQADAINSSEGETIDSVVNDIQENCRKYFKNFDKIPTIYPISALPALVSRSKHNLEYNKRKDFSPEEKRKLLNDSGIEVFEERLMKYLTQGEKAQSALLSPVELALSFLKVIKEDLEEEIKDLSDNRNAEELQQEKDELEIQLLQLKEQLNNSRSELSEKISEIITDTRNAIKSNIRDEKVEFAEKMSQDTTLEELSDQAEYYVSNLRSKCYSIVCECIYQADYDFRSLLLSRYQDLTDELRAKLNKAIIRSDEFEINSISLDTTKFDIDINLKDYLDKRTEIKDKLDKVEKQREEAEEKDYENKRNEEKRKQLQEELNNLNDEYRLNLSSLGQRPSAVAKTRTEKKWRGGILGKIATMFIGKKTVSHTEYDESDRNRFDTEKAEIEKEYKQEKKKIKEQMDAIPASSLVYNDLLLRLERTEKRYKEDLEEIEKKKENDLEKTKRAKLRGARNYINSCFEEMENESLTQLLKILDDSRNDMEDIAKDVLENGISATIRQKQEKLQRRIEELQSDAIQKDELRKQKETNKNVIVEQLSELHNIYDELKGIEIDTIERQ